MSRTVNQPIYNAPLVDTVDRAFMQFLDNDRVQSLLGYGSVIDDTSVRSRIRSDVDVYLLLDTFNEDDIEKTRLAAAGIDRTIDLTLHYRDELPRNPANFTLGTKSCLALAYLASAHTIQGSNPFIEMYEQLDDAALRRSALDAMVLYVSRMRTEITNPTNPENFDRRIEKYMARILIDAMIFYDRTTYEPFKRREPVEIIDMAAQHPRLGSPIAPYVLRAVRGEQQGQLALMQAACCGVRHDYNDLKSK